MKLVSGNSNISLAESIAKYLGVDLVNATVKNFLIKKYLLKFMKMLEEKMFVIQSTSFPTNDHLMELLITIDALKRGSAKELQQ